MGYRWLPAAARRHNNIILAYSRARRRRPSPSNPVVLIGFRFRRRVPIHENPVGFNSWISENERRQRDFHISIKNKKNIY